MNHVKTRVTGRGWAYVGAILGGSVSIAANVAHSYVPPAGAPVDWQPETGAVIGAVFWPVALFVAVEIFARIAWPAGRRWVTLRFGGLLPVALVAAVVSYRHLAGLLAFYAEDPLTATIGPLAVDGLMVMATGALIATGRQRTATAPAPATVIVPALTETVLPDRGERAGTGTSHAARTGTSGRRRSGTRTAGRARRRTDPELIAALADVPRESDGTVPVRRAAAALGTGPDRARRLLAAQGLLRTTPTPSTLSSSIEPAVTPVAA